MVSLRNIWIAGSLWLALASLAYAQSEAAPAELIRSGGVQTLAPQLTPPVDATRDGFERPPTLRDPLVRNVAHETKVNAEQQIAVSKPLPLAARGTAKREDVERPLASSPWQSLATVGGSLAFVLALFFSLAFLTRRGLPRGMAKLPGEVIEVLGKTPFTKGQELQLVRIGTKLLLLCVTPHGCETLTEINDPAEVDRLSSVCRRHHPQGVSAAFDQLLVNVGREPAQGFAGQPRSTVVARGGQRHA